MVLLEIIRKGSILLIFCMAKIQDKLQEKPLRIKMRKIYRLYKNWRRVLVEIKFAKTTT